MGRKSNMFTITEHPYIVRDDDILDGEPIIKGTRTPVRAIAEWWKFGASPDEILENLPYLTLSQIFDALSYYHVNSDEIERYIQENRLEESGQEK
jgi:uncharacterized protein (DUF433 family)